MRNRTPASLYALTFGGVLVVAGIIGFFYEPEFTSDEAVRDSVFGILDVNGWHNVVHIATGALGLLAFAGGAYGGADLCARPRRRLHRGRDLGLRRRRRRLDPEHHPGQH